jgi:hypothetical protein
MNSLDCNANPYREIHVGNDRLRVTFLTTGWSGEPAIRLQVRDEAGHLRQGPEVPVRVLAELLGASFALVLEATSVAPRRVS